jgi:hypothetical protein
MGGKFENSQNDGEKLEKCFKVSSIASAMMLGLVRSYFVIHDEDGEI